MKTFGYIALAGLACATPALAQDTAPDGSKAFGIEPYLAVMGGYHDFDSDNRGRLSTNCNAGSGCPDGAIVEGLVGVNIPLGAFFVGAEGGYAKGFRGIRHEYGGYGRFGFRAGESGLIYGKVGYQRVSTRAQGHDHDMSYGGGVEIGPKSIGLGGLTGSSGVRLRFEVTTFDLQSIRPTGGLVFHF